MPPNMPMPPMPPMGPMMNMQMPPPITMMNGMPMSMGPGGPHVGHMRPPPPMYRQPMPPGGDDQLAAMVQNSINAKKGGAGGGPGGPGGMMGPNIGQGAGMLKVLGNGMVPSPGLCIVLSEPI
jgi:hypothetical protein